MLVYHLGVTRFAKQLTGEGAKLHGGRWNKIGQPCLYACESKSLCALEYAANVSLEEMPENLSFTTYEIPDDGWTVFLREQLPQNWNDTPAPESTQAWGTKQLQTHFIIRVPSVIIPTEFNFAMNPVHPNFKKVRIKEIEAFTFDRRIKK